MVLPRSLITPLASELSKFSLSPLSPHQHKGENVVCKGLFSTIFSYSLMISLIPWLLQSSPKSTFSADWNVRLWDITTRVFHCVLNSASPAVSHWARPACRSTKPALYKTSCFIWCHPPNLQDKRPYNYIQCLSLLSFLCSLCLSSRQEFLSILLLYCLSNLTSESLPSLTSLFLLTSIIFHSNLFSLRRVRY